MKKEIESYPLERIRHSKEDRPQKKSFVPLDGLSIGLEINWTDEQLRYFLYKDRRKNRTLTSEWIALYSSEQELREPLYAIISEHYRAAGRGQTLPDYTKIELNLPIGHLHYHIWAGTLQKILQKEIIYN